MLPPLLCLCFQSTTPHVPKSGHNHRKIRTVSGCCALPYVTHLERRKINVLYHEYTVLLCKRTFGEACRKICCLFALESAASALCFPSHPTYFRDTAVRFRNVSKSRHSVATSCKKAVSWETTKRMRSSRCCCFKSAAIRSMFFRSMPLVGSSK